MHPKLKDGYAQMGEHVFGWNMQAYSRFSPQFCPTVKHVILSQRIEQFNKTKNSVQYAVNKQNMVNATNKPNMGKTDNVLKSECFEKVSLEIGVLEDSFGI